MISRLGVLIFFGVLMSSLVHAAQPIAKVRVSSSGQISLNGVATTQQSLDKAFAKLSAEHGVVWYYREAAGAEPPPQAMEVVQLVVKYRLPISMSTKADFSDTVDSNGNSVPRKP